MMNLKKIVLMILGVSLLLLGLLWTLQGTGLLVIPPILCVANCATMTEPTPLWVVLGVGLMTVGGILAHFSLKISKKAQ